MSTWWICTLFSQCKHILAVYLCQAMAVTQQETVSDQQMSALLSSTETRWQQVDQKTRRLQEESWFTAAKTKLWQTADVALFMFSFGVSVHLEQLVLFLVVIFFFFIWLDQLGSICVVKSVYPLEFCHYLKLNYNKKKHLNQYKHGLYYQNNSPYIQIASC